MHGHAEAIVQQAGVVFGSHRRPDQLGHEPGHRLAGRSLAHPSEHVGLRGAVQEAIAVRRLRPQRGQEPVQPSGLSPRLAPAFLRPPADPLVQAPDVGPRVVVLLVEGNPAAHVQHMPHRGAGVPTSGQFRHVTGDLAIGVELAPVDEHGRHAAQHGLRHRHQRVGPVRSSLGAVPFGDELAVLQYHVCVGVGVREDVAHGARRPVGAGHDDRERISTRRGST